MDLIQLMLFTFNISFKFIFIFLIATMYFLFNLKTIQNEKFNFNHIVYRQCT